MPADVGDVSWRIVLESGVDSPITTGGPKAVPVRSMTAEPAPLAERIGDAANVLLVGPSRSDADDRACIDLLTVADPTEEAMLSVTFTQSPTDRLAVWERFADAYPSIAAFVVGSNGADPDGPAESLRRAVPDSTELAVDRVDSPGDLMRLGVRISERLAEWSAGDRQIVMCVHTLSILFRYADPERLFRFLHVLTRRVDHLGGVAHYHLDPGSHDEESILLLDPLFDVTVEIGNDGERTVRR